MKLGFQISSTLFIHFGGFGFTTYQHPISNEVVELVPKKNTQVSPNQDQSKNKKKYIYKQNLNDLKRK